MKKKIWIPLVFVIILAAGAVYYFMFYLPSQVVPPPAYNSTKVRVGDIVITTSGVGNILPAEKVVVGFQTSGILESLNVAVGDQVEKGDVLASLDEADVGQKLVQAETNLRSFYSAKALNQAELSLLAAQTDYNKVLDDLVDLIGLDASNLQLVLADAQSSLEQVKLTPDSSEAEIESAEEAVVAAEENLNDALAVYESDDAVTFARAKFKSAYIALREAETYLSVLQNGGADPVEVGISVSPGSDLSKLQQAQWDYDKALADFDKTILKAPISGTVTELNGSVGQAVNNAPFITIETLDAMALMFYIEEQDISLLKIGNKVEVTFDAYPSVIVNGSIAMIEPALKTFEGNSVAVVWATLDEPMEIPLLSGMSADVEVIAAETRDALLVPIQALREISPGSYSVFVVQPDESLRMVLVTVGLQDYANAEILSGLEQGDIISTGSVETK